MSTPYILALIQARLGSSRLPGKSALPLPLGAVGAEGTLLGRVVQRASQATAVREIVVATTTAPADDALAMLATALGVGVFRGSETDVLGRFAGALAAVATPVAAVVRLTADNPALDPSLLERAISYHLATRADYTHTTGLPLGTNLEIISPQALLRAHDEASQPDEREHVTPYLRRHPELFKLETLALTVPPAIAALRLTIDYASDYALLSLLYEVLGPGFTLAELPALLGCYPWLTAVNAENIQL